MEERPFNMFKFYSAMIDANAATGVCVKKCNILSKEGEITSDETECLGNSFSSHSMLINNNLSETCATNRAQAAVARRKFLKNLAKHSNF